MQISQACIDLVKDFEKCRLVAFKPTPTDPWTLGWGHTVGVYEGQNCSQAQADQWLADDLQHASQGVANLVTVPITQGEFDALTSFAYNLGIGALHGSTLLRLLNAGNPTGAALEFPRWDHAGGVELEGLERRRLAEQALFRS